MRYINYNTSQAPYPIDTQFCLTSKCNLSCVICWRNADWFSETDLVSSSLERTMSRFKKLFPLLNTLQRLNLTGSGEPILDPALFNILEITKNYKMLRVELNTNGLLLSKDIGEKLIDLNLGYIDFHIDSPEENTYLYLMRGGNFKEVLKNLDNLVKLRAIKQTKTPTIGIVMVVVKDNIKQIKDMVSLASNIGVDLIKVQYAQIYRKEIIDWSIFYHQKRLKEELKYAKEKANKLGLIFYDGISNSLIKKRFEFLTNFFKKEIYCNYPWNSCTILNNGNVHPCCMTGPKIGNLDNEDFDKIWNGEKVKKIRTLFLERKIPEKCKSCYLMGKGTDKYFILKRVNS